MTAIRIDLTSKVAPFEQIKASIIGAIADGSLPVGHRLPSIRQLAADLGVAPNTVARSYRELEDGGFVMSRGRRGTTVLEPPAASAPFDDDLTDAVNRAREMGRSPAEIIQTVIASLA